MSANVYNPTTGTLTPYAGSVEAVLLSSLDDVDITSISNGQLLKYNGSAEVWENANESLSDLADTNISSPSNGQILKYNGTSGKWVNGTEETVQYSTMPTASADYLGKIVQYVGATDTYTNGYFYICANNNGTYSWIAKNVQASSGGGGTTINSLSDIADVNLSNLSNGQMIKWDSSSNKWINDNIPSGGTSDYAELENKPSINSVTLSGNKTTSDLNISYNDLTNKPSIPSVDDCYKTSDSAETTLDDTDKFPFYDNSASAKRNSTWSNIKSVLKTYFDTLYSTVKTRSTPASGGSTLSLVNTGDMYNWNNKIDTAGTCLSKSGTTLNVSKLSSGGMDDIVTPLPSSASKYMIYSTEEQVVGQWIDGKTIYQKTVSCGAMPNNTTKTVAHGISNVSKIIHIEGYTTNATEYVTLPYVSITTSNLVQTQANATNITIKTAANLSSYSESYVTLRYTKTT